MGAPRQPGGARFANALADDYVVAAFEAYRHEIFSFLARATANDAAARELLQVAFQRLAREARDGRFPDDVSAWLLSMAANLALRGFHQRSVVSRLVERFSPSTEPWAIGREGVADMERALLRLPDHERLALLLASRGISGRAALDDHLAGCESCRRIAPQLEARARLLASLPLRSLPDRDADAILARVLRGGFRVPPVRLMGTTAVLVLVALVTFAVGADLLRRSHYPATPIEPAIAAPSAVVGAGDPPAEDVFLTP